MFEDLFEYQKNDVELYNIDRKLKSSDEYKKYALNYKAFDESKKQMEKLEQDAQLMLSNQKKIDEMSESVEKLVSSIEDIKSVLKHEDEIEDVNEIEYYKDSLAKIVAQIENYEKEIKAIASKIADVKKKYAETVATYKKAKEGGKEAQDKFKAVQESVADQVKSLKESLAKAKPDLLKAYPKIMEIYERCRGEKKLPAIVEKNGDYCGACGVEIDADLKGKLKKSGDFVECPNCHKVIVVK